MHAGTQVLDAINPHLYSFIKHNDDRRVLIIGNFSEQRQTIPARDFSFSPGTVGRDLLADQPYELSGDLMIDPYQLLWIAVED
jgi:hypothetical protein